MRLSDEQDIYDHMSYVHFSPIILTDKTLSAGITCRFAEVFFNAKKLIVFCDAVAATEAFLF